MIRFIVVAALVAFAMPVTAAELKIPDLNMRIVRDAGRVEIIVKETSGREFWLYEGTDVPWEYIRAVIPDNFRGFRAEPENTMTFLVSVKVQGDDLSQLRPRRLPPPTFEQILRKLP